MQYKHNLAALGGSRFVPQAARACPQCLSAVSSRLFDLFNFSPPPFSLVSWVSRNSANTMECGKEDDIKKKDLSLQHMKSVKLKRA